MKIRILVLGFCFVSVAGFAAELNLADSVGIEKVGDKSYIVHQVEPQETLFAISRRYNTPVNEIVQSNESLKEGLKVGQRIKVPFVEKEAIPEGAKIHKVAAGETLFSIAKEYGISLQDLMGWNDLQGNDLSTGQSLIIHGVEKPPVSDVTEEPEAEKAVADQNMDEVKQPEQPILPEEPSPKNEEETPAGPTTESPPTTTKGTASSGSWISHTVDQGETLFAIAKKYDAKVEDLIKWNGLSSNNLSVGQSLKVGRESAVVPVTRYPANSEEPSEEKPSASPSSSSTSSTSSGASSAGRGVSTSTEFKNVNETGQAEVIEGTGNHKKYLVLHRTAPVGTIMRVRNEENDITIFARVVGTLPDIGDNDRLVIKVSKAAFDQLRAVNSKFPVEISY